MMNPEVNAMMDRLATCVGGVVRVKGDDRDVVGILQSVTGTSSGLRFVFGPNNEYFFGFDKAWTVHHVQNRDPKFEVIVTSSGSFNRMKELLG